MIFLQIAYLNKTKGLKGALKVSFEAFFLEYLALNEIPDYFFIQTYEGFIPFFVQKIQGLGRKDTVIFFEDINNIDKAKPYQHLPMFVKEDLLEDFFEEEIIDLQSLCGYELWNLKEKVGIIEKVIEYPNNIILQSTFKGKEVLIPFTDDWIRVWDDAKCRLVMALPEGLLDL